ncbi:MAG: hypothetical protein JXR70_11130 [Spirochaetales bacterium]|nr:hypothetical protein [Spirochaetales bacterium]
MKPYYIQLDKLPGSELSAVLEKHLKISLQEAEALVEIGAVWDHERRIRLKNPQAKLANILIKIYRPLEEVKPYQVDIKDIIYINNHYCIVYKHPNSLSHPAPYSDVASLAWGLEKYFGKKVYPVNRLDYITGGLIFFAFTQKAGSCLQSDFQNRKIKKWYLARTEKVDNAGKYTLIDDPITHKNKLKQARSIAIHYYTDENSDYFLVKLQSGRTHQIRIHLAKKYKPIWGDKSYGARHSRGTGLYCVRYVFTCPISNQKIRVCYLPDDIKTWLVPLGLKNQDLGN